MKARITFWFLAVIIALNNTTISAQEHAGQSAAEALSSKLVALNSFQASFVQFIVDRSGSTIQQTEGVLKAKRPGLFYWYTSPPLEQYVKSDGKEVWVYDPDLEQVTVHKSKQELSTTPAILLSGDVAKLSESYLVEQMSGDGVENFSLKPNSEDSLFETLRLRFIDDKLVEMRLVDGLGQKTTLSFSNVTVNPNLTDSDFEIQLPDNIDIIRE